MLRRMSDADDLVKNAGRFFSKLGGTLKETAKVAGAKLEEGAKIAGAKLEQTTKHVTGLGRGTVKLELDQTKITPGGTLHGRVVLELAEPIDARRLVVSLRARQKMVTVKKDASGRSVGASHADVYQFDLELGGVQRYESTTLAFELTVPPDALDLKPTPGANPLADVVRSVASALGPAAGPVEWQVVGKLEIAWGRDLGSSVDIVIAH